MIDIDEDLYKATVNGLDVDEIWDLRQAVANGTPLPKGHCKDCKWWKDSDGAFRRGSHAESQCPINRREVLEGNGYCYMFEPQESEGEE